MELKITQYSSIAGILLTILLHSMMGLQPVLSRYLQTFNVPSFSINSIACIIGSILFIPRIIIRFIIYLSREKKSLQSIFSETSSQIKKDWKWKRVFMTVIVMFLFSCVIMVRSISNLLATKFTRALYVQLISLTAPFFTIILSFSISMIWRYILLPCPCFSKISKTQQPTTSKSTKLIVATLFVMLLATIGGSFIIIGGVCSTDNDFWTISWSKLVNDFSYQDLIGIGIAFSRNIAYAIYAIMIEFIIASPSSQQPIIQKEQSDEEIISTREESIELKQEEKEMTILSEVDLESTPQNEETTFPIGDTTNQSLIQNEDIIQETPTQNEPFIYELQGENFMYYLMILYTVVYSLLSFIFREDWSIYLNMDWKHWIALIVYSLFFFYIVDGLYIIAVKMVGAAGVNSIMVLSMFSTILFSYIILQEVISNIWQIVGIGIVFVAVVCFAVANNRLK